ncbi:hypothetical protein GGR56DRAFT_522146 [Xylariaceae sp. FL0804]|nr:hypothetical protein GGR56DRAFT_522146 [Xylariaceae sp. FL0804]
MASIAALRTNFPKKLEKITNRTSSQTPQPPAPAQQQQPSLPQQQVQQAQQQQQQQEDEDDADDPPEGPPPGTVKTLELAPRGHSMVVSNPDGSPLLTFTFASGSSANGAPDLIALCGDGGGDEVASAQFHRWTTSKTDVHYHHHDNNSGSGSGGDTVVRVKKNFESSTGLGPHARWEKDGRKAMKLLVGGKRGMGMKKKEEAELVARFEAVGAGSKRKKGTGQFDVVRPGLSREQLEEVVVSCLVERERMRRDGEIVKEGAWELFAASTGLPLP